MSRLSGAHCDIESIETVHKSSPINFEPIEDINKERNISSQTAVNIDFGNKEGEFLVNRGLNWCVVL